MISSRSVDSTRVGRAWGALTGRERASIGGITGFVALLHVVGWGALITVVASQDSPARSAGAFSIGLGVTAYTLGLRHAFDADHIAAIDNTTRKLMNEGTRPLSVGFWFSLGHSTIVFGLVVLLAEGARALASQLTGGSASLHTVFSLIGTGVSGTFLYVIGIINLVVLLGIVKVFRRMRGGDFDEAALEHQLNSRGFMNRFFGRASKIVTRPWQMYIVGLLFGLGFDTATEVSLLILAGGAAAFSLPWYAILTLPILFAAGMSLLDSADGCFMNFAYGWAFSKPVRKIYYNIVITALSVAVALIIGSIELISILVTKADIRTGPLAAIGRLDLNDVGYAIVGLFVLAWLVALVIWRFARIEEKWSATIHRQGSVDGA